MQVKPKGAISSQGEPSKRKAGETRRFGGKMLDDVIRVTEEICFEFVPLEFYLQFECVFPVCQLGMRCLERGRRKKDIVIRGGNKTEGRDKPRKI